MSLPRQAEKPDDRDEVLHAFGQVMREAQYWERAVLLLDHNYWLVNEHRDSGDLGTPGTTAALERLNRVMLESTLGTIRNRLPKYLTEQEVDEVETLTGVRNQLAHRFLMQQEIDAEGDTFSPGTVEQLKLMWDAFSAAASRYVQRAGEVPDYRGTTEPHWEETAATMSAKLLRLGERLEADDLRHPNDLEPPATS